MNIPNRASRNHASRSSRFVRESRHQRTSELLLSGRPNSSAAKSELLEMEIAAVRINDDQNLKRNFEFIKSKERTTTASIGNDMQFLFQNDNGVNRINRRRRQIDDANIFIHAMTLLCKVGLQLLFWISQQISICGNQGR